jgi:hypothetical protein
VEYVFDKGIDTHPKMQQLYNDLLMQKSGEERLMMASEMFGVAKEIAIQDILSKQPNLTTGEVRAELFLRFYGHEISEPQKSKIIRPVS